MSKKIRKYIVQIDNDAMLLVNATSRANALSLSADYWDKRNCYPNIKMVTVKVIFEEVDPNYLGKP